MTFLLWISLAFICLSLCILIYLTIRGQNILERVLTFDLIAIVAIAALMIFYFAYDEKFFMDIAILLALVGFVTALVFSIFIPKDREKK